MGEITNTITIDKDAYDELLTRSADWDNIHVIAEKVKDSESAIATIKAILGVWEK